MKFRCEIVRKDYLKINCLSYFGEINLRIESDGYGKIAITSPNGLRKLIRKLEKAGRKVFKKDWEVTNE